AETCKDLQSLNIGFVLLKGQSVSEVPKFVRKLQQLGKKGPVHAVVCDMSPLRVPRSWTAGVAKALQNLKVPLLQVDAHNVVPVWEASDKQETGARTLRPKITKRLKEFLVDFPSLRRHPTAPLVGKTGGMPKAVQLKSQIKAKFHELDVNKDGCLSFEELTVFLGCLSTKLTEKEVREIFRTMDRNRDEKVQFDEFVDFIFSSEMDKNPRLRADVEAAAKRSTDNVARVESAAARERSERLRAEKGGRERLGRLTGRYAFRWQGDADEAETFELVLQDSGKFESKYFSQLDATMTDTQTCSGVWEVSATEREILLYKEGGGPVERWALDARGDLDAGKDFALSKQRMILRADDDCLA
ncbi:phr, partial [Symbiodinium pilosum]